MHQIQHQSLGYDLTMDLVLPEGISHESAVETRCAFLLWFFPLGAFWRIELSKDKVASTCQEESPLPPMPLLQRWPLPCSAAGTRSCAASSSLHPPACKCMPCRDHARCTCNLLTDIAPGLFSSAASAGMCTLRSCLEGLTTNVAETSQQECAW